MLLQAKQDAAHEGKESERDAKQQEMVEDALFSNKVDISPLRRQQARFDFFLAMLLMQLAQQLRENGHGDLADKVAQLRKDCLQQCDPSEQVPTLHHAHTLLTQLVGRPKEHVLSPLS